MSTTARRPFHETSRNSREEAVSRTGALFMSVALVAALAWAGVAGAQLPLNAVGSSFDITGFMQAATLDAPGDVLAGGTVQVNGHTIIVPRNTIFQMPAFALTWQQLFAMAPPPYTGTQTGLALGDIPAPLGTYEVHVQGNRIGNTYIAGLIFMSQQSLNAGQGFVNFIDYANNELRVGGVINDPSTGTRVKINDPSGRFAPVFSLDPRFTLDSDNPTFRTETGFPMCFPHVNPAAADDPLCPQRNRPTDPGTGFPLGIFTMQDPAALPQMALPALGPATGTNPYVAAPIEVGDYVTFAGTLLKDGPQPSAGPLPANGIAGTYIAAHTLIANAGIYTVPGTNPAYVATDVMILGVGGLPIAGIEQEATIRTRFEGFTTDGGSGAARIITLWGIDVDACSALTGDRSWGTIDVDQGPPTAACPLCRGAVKGRWRYRPPTTILTGPPAGTYLPPTRMMRSALSGAYSAAAPVISNNGLITGQYAAPIFTFLFPENLRIGGIPVPFNFTDFPFLVNGTFAALPGLNVGQLVAFPAATVPAPKCGPPPAPAPPTAIATSSPAAPVTNTVVTLDGSASSDPNGLAIAWSWTAPAGITLNSTTVSKPTFTPTLAGTYTFSLIVTNTLGLPSAPASVTVTVTNPVAAVAPTANAGAAQNVAAGAVVQLNGTASLDPNVPAQALTYAWTQTAGAPMTLSSATSATPTFTATPTLAIQTLTFSLTVTNTSLLTSAASTVTITVRAAVAPTAVPGPNQSVLANTALTNRLVQLDGSGSFDPNGLPITYSWSPGGGVTLSSTTIVNPTFRIPNSQTKFPINLQVRNSLGQTSTNNATTQVTINVVDAGHADTVAITGVVYAISKQRLTVTATSAIATASPTLAPVLSLVGFGPNGTNLQMAFAAPTYTVIVSGVAQPASVTVTGSAGGSASSPVLTIKP
jgi:PKD domain